MSDPVFDFDVLIVGGGAAGLTAAIYSVRYNLSTLVVSADFGGQILKTGDIENWPGIKKITGPQLSQNFYDHAEALGAKLAQGTVKSIVKENIGFTAVLDSGFKDSVKVRSVILCAGAVHRKLGIPGEEALAGRGVSYCATCDGPFFRNKTVAVVGGGDSAVTGALDLSSYVAGIYQVHMLNDFQAKPFYVDALKKNPKVEILMGTKVVEAKGEGKLEAVILDKPFNGSTELKVDGLFIEIGFLPENSLAKQLGLEIDGRGYIKVQPDQSTSVAGVFAAGDVTNNSNYFAQLVTAAGEGSVAADSAFRYLQMQAGRD